jgi:hypothetical protein
MLVCPALRRYPLFSGKDLKAAGKWLIDLLEPSPVEPVREETQRDSGVVSEDGDDSSVLTARNVAICRGVVRYLSSLFSRLGDVETIERELMRCVAEEVSAATRDA